MSAPSRHLPVLLAEVIKALAPRDGGLYIDGTFGGGGYARAILAAANCRVLGLDRDPAALARASSLLAGSAGRLTLKQSSFAQIESVVRDMGEIGADGVALDLGISSDQLDEPERGFSFVADGPLDMRMGDSGPTASDFVNQLDEPSLAALLKHFGEENNAKRIARGIVEARKEKPLTRTRELADLIERLQGPRAKALRIHPATRSFQALRIAVNNELTELAQGLAAAERLLRPMGRLVVVSFHSLEDRIVKRFLAERSGKTGTGSRHRPEAQAREPSFRLLTTRAVTPSDQDVERNPRARSSRLRAAERSFAQPHPFDLSRLGLSFDHTLPAAAGARP